MKRLLLLTMALCFTFLCACSQGSTDYTLQTEHIHNFTQIAAVAPTCTTDGVTKKQECACGYIEGGDIIPATGHSFVSYPELAPTPSQNGHTAYSQCTVCEYLEGYSETEYVYPCIDLLPSAYDRISVFNLTENDKKEILGMYEAVLAFRESYTFQTIVNSQQVAQYYNILAFSLPETMMIYTSYQSNPQGNKIGSITFQYILTQQQYIDRMTALETAVKPLLSQVHDMTDFEKIKYFNNYLIEKCTYTLEATDVNNAYGALVNGINHCDGFSDAMNLLCNAAGIRCQSVLGYNPVYHAWNIIEMDGKYYYFDLTTNNVDWYNKPLYMIFGASRKHIESIGYTLHQDYSNITPAAPTDLNIGNRYMLDINVGTDVKSEMTAIANQIIDGKPKHVYVHCHSQEIYDAAKGYNNSVIVNSIKKAYPDADVQAMFKNTFKTICIIIAY